MNILPPISSVAKPCLTGMEKVGMKARTSGKEKAGLQIAGEPGLTTIHRGTGLRTPTTSFGIVSR